jgi:mannose-6-phosphate isomerase
LHRFEPRVGDCVFLPAGTIHALGAGLLVAEIQQSSDTTYRLFDWNRIGADGRPRPLHVEQALDVADYARGPVNPQRPAPTDRPHVERLVESDKFILDRWKFDSPQTIGGDDRFHLIAVLDGQMEIPGTSLSRGNTALFSAALSTLEMMPQGYVTLLDAYLP